MSTWSSAFIPFCAFKTDLNISKKTDTLPGITYPLCSSFLPTVLEGQLCYQLKLNDTSGQGKGYELMLLLDYNEDLSLHTSSNENRSDNFSKEKLNFNRAIESIQGVSAKIQINTLSPYIGFGGGSYMMTVVKRMTAKKDFLKMPLKERNCEVELYDDCRTRKLLEECNCVPWEVPGFQVQNYSKSLMCKLLFRQDLEVCSPKGRDCIERNSTKSFNCRTTCEGIYADVQWVGKKIEEMEDGEAEEDLEKEFEGKVDENMNKLQKRLVDLEREMKLMKSSGQEKGEELDKEKYKLLIAEYRKFKTKNVKHFRFNSAENSSSFGKS